MAARISLNFVVAGTANNPHNVPGNAQIRLGDCGDCHGRVEGRLPQEQRSSLANGKPAPVQLKSDSVSHLTQGPEGRSYAGPANPVATAPNANLSADLSGLANLQPGQWYEV
ncbi:MAG: hypothetical protein ACRERU_21510, partial [Methylococcales bacterium]